MRSGLRSLRRLRRWTRLQVERTSLPTVAYTDRIMGPFSPELTRRLAGAASVAVLTGAGVSAESGIPTFRDPGGIWEQFKPEELANISAFLRNPKLVQGWYEHRRLVAREKHPNSGHTALAELEDLVPAFTLITQNVDDLHRRAGSRRIVELHGNIMRSFCIDCGRSPGEAEMLPDSEGAIRCAACSGLLRPDVVWFGEMLPMQALEGARDAAIEADVFLTVGTSGVVYPAADLPVLAHAHGAYVVEINVERSAIAGQLDEVVLGPAGEVLPALVDAVRAAR